MSDVPVHEYILTLPYPPTVNHYYHNRRGGGRFIGKAGRIYRQTVAVLCLQEHVKTTGQVKLKIIAWPPDNRQRDLDNLLKALFDALQAAGAIENDRLIRGFSLDWGGAPVKGGKVMVMIDRIGV